MMRRKYGPRGKIGPAPRFVWDEVRCTDGSLRSDMKFRRAVVKQARMLNTLRHRIAKKYGVPKANVGIAVNSWYRSPRYNAQIRGASNSQHLYGKATDIRVYVTLRSGKRVMLTPKHVAALAGQVPGFLKGGRGWYDRAHGLFTHLDHRNGRAVWVNR